MRIEPNNRFTKTVGGAGEESGNSVDTDSLGNVYIGGQFSGSFNFDPDGTDVHASQGDVDAFISKYDPNGNYQWTRVWGSTGHDFVNNVTVSSNGRIYVAGAFSGTTDFDPMGATDIRDSAGNHDAFVAAYDLNGNYQWAHTWGSVGFDYAYDVAPYPDEDRLYVSGRFMNTVDFDFGAGTANRTSNGSTDAYIAQYDLEGTFQWVQTWGGINGDGVGSIALSADGSANLAGWFQNTVDFDPGAGTDSRVTAGGADAFVARYAPDGTYQWARTWGGVGADFSDNIIVDGEDNIHTGGRYSSTVDFDPTGSVDSHTSNGLDDVFLATYHTDGSYQRVITWGGAGYDTPSYFGGGLETDANGSIYITGNFTGSVDFDPGAGTDIYSTSGSPDDEYAGYITMYNGDGSYGWTRILSASAWTIGYELALDSNDNMNVVGGFNDTVNFDQDGSDEHTSNGQSDIFFNSFSLSQFHHVTNLAANLVLTDKETGDSATDLAEGVPKSSNTTLHLATTEGLPLADVAADMIQDRDWSDVTAGNNVKAGKAFVHGLADVSGVKDYSLYIPKINKHKLVGICPGASSLGDTGSHCENLQTYTAKDANVEVVRRSNRPYWLVSGLTSTGGFSSEGLASSGIDNQSLTLLAIGIMTIGGLAYGIRWRYA